MSYLDEISKDADEAAFDRLSAKHSTLDDFIKHRDSGTRFMVGNSVAPERNSSRLFSKNLSGVVAAFKDPHGTPGEELLIDGGKGVYTFKELFENAERFYPSESKKKGFRAVAQDSNESPINLPSNIKRIASGAYNDTKAALKDAMIDAPMSDGVTIDDDLATFDSGAMSAKRVIITPENMRRTLNNASTSRVSKTAARVERLEKKAARAFKKGELKKSARFFGRAQLKRESRRAKLFGLLQKATSKKVVIIATGALIALIFVGILMSAVFGGVAQMMARSSSMGNLSATEQQIATFFMSNGLDAVQTAAILGNIRVEVGGEIGDEFDVDQTQDGHICLAPNYSNCGRSGTAHGLFQLECDGRFQALNNYAAKTNRHWTDLSVQCEYMLFEDIPPQFEHHSRQYVEYSKVLGPSYDGIAGLGYYMSFDDWKRIDDVDWATECFCRVVERAGKPWMDRRKSYAQRYLAMLTMAPATDGSTSVQRAYNELGKPYVWGASGPNSWDCSGLVYYCISGKVGGHPETTYTLYRKSQIISGAEAQPGDLVHMYFSGGSPSHVGLYIGGGKMIHAPHSGDVVKISYVPNGAQFGRFIG